MLRDVGHFRATVRKQIVIRKSLYMKIGSARNRHKFYRFQVLVNKILKLEIF